MSVVRELAQKIDDVLHPFEKVLSTIEHFKDTMNGQSPAMPPANTPHGKPLRGLLSCPPSGSSKSQFEGRFGRLFCLPGATYGATKEDSLKALETLSEAMTAPFDLPKDGTDAEESGIPALYTYFGQFIDHDITFDPVSTLTEESDPNALVNFRNPALDLDNVYGRGPNDQPYLYDDNGMHFLLGERLDDQNGVDLPRSGARRARAMIGDPRNDENMIISQFQGLMLRLHNRVVDENPDLKFPQVQQIVRWHYQWVVIHDFLRRIVSKDVLDALMTNGQYDRNKLNFYQLARPTYMPVEFSVAAYRLGHSMIRSGYRLNDNDATLLPVFPIPDKVAGGKGGISDGLSGFQALGKDRGIDWHRFIDIGAPRPDGDQTGDVDPPNLETKKRLQFAYRIDTSIATSLSVLPESVAPDQPRSLAQRNLLRGFYLGLPTGQEVAHAMGVTPLHDNEILIGKAVDPIKANKEDYPKPLADFPDLHAFRGKCPLWTYILAEANANAEKNPVKIPVDPPKTINTPQLGAVGGRIVAEVFLGLLFGDQHSFVNCKTPFTPSLGGAKGQFYLRDIVSYALGHKGDTNGNMNGH